MKKLILLLAVVLLFSFCSGEKIAFSQKPGIIPESPGAGYNFTYTPVIDIFSPELGKNISFLGFDGENLFIDTNSDKSFIFSLNLETRETINLTNKLGFHSAEFVSNGESYYFIRNSSVLRKNIASGEETEIIYLDITDFKYNSAYGYDLYKTGKYIVAEKAFENGGKHFYFYDSESGEEKFFGESSAVPGHKTIPFYGNITFAEKKNGSYSLFAINPESKTGKIRGPVIAGEIICSAYDGKHFVWSTESGIYFKNSAGQTVQLSSVPGKFAFLGRNFIYWLEESGKLLNYRIDKNRFGEYSDFSGLEFVFADENIAVLKSNNDTLGEEYLSIQMKVGREEKTLEDVADMAPATVAVDGYFYYCFYEKSETEPSERQIAGKITSAFCDHSTCPRRNDQGNSTEFLGARYAFVDGELLLEKENGKGWYKCKKDTALADVSFENRFYYN